MIIEAGSATGKPLALIDLPHHLDPKVRRLLTTARRRYHLLPIPERPGPHPNNINCLFSLQESLSLGVSLKVPGVIDWIIAARVASRSLCRSKRIRRLQLDLRTIAQLAPEYWRGLHHIAIQRMGA